MTSTLIALLNRFIGFVLAGSKAKTMTSTGNSRVERLRLEETEGQDQETTTLLELRV